MPSDFLNVAVVGAGSFGRHHARVYRDLERGGEPVHLVAVVDSDLSRASAVAAEFAAQPFRTIGEMLAAAPPQAASVAVPTVQHAMVARELMQAGVDVLIEKPLATSLAEADEIIATAEASGRVGQVGHLERFNPAVRAAVPLLSEPMFFEIHRLSVFSPRALDVDVVLDLMIHDLDIVLSFVPSPIAEIRAVGLPILSPKVDIANVRMEFENGCVANFTASRVSTEKIRKMRFFQPRQYLSVDYSRQDLLVFTVDLAAAPKPLPPMQEIRTGMFDFKDLLEAVGPRAELTQKAGDERMQVSSNAAGTSPLPGISMMKPPVVSEEPLRAEIRSFLDAVRHRSRPMVSLADGRRALAAALDILEHIAAHNRRIGR